MGYYTKFSLRVEPAELHDQVECELTRLAYHDDGPSPFDPESWNGGQGCKWYTHQHDCLALSAAMPGVTIRVQGIGEEDDDRWRRVYRDGKEVGFTQLSDYSHKNAQGESVCLRDLDDAYLRNVVRWALRHMRVRGSVHSRMPVSDGLAVMVFRSIFADAVDECAWRGILPTVDALRVAWDVACSRGHVDAEGKPREIVHVCAGPVREGEERPTWTERGPRDLVELWVGYCPQARETT